MDNISENDRKTNYYEYLYKNSIVSDITFIVKGEVIKAHKEVLGSKNPVFLEKFASRGPMLKRIEIPFLDPKAFRIYMHYMYTGKIPDENVTEELLLVAHNYLDINLMNVCREKLRKTVTAKNVIPRLDAFIKCEEKEIVEELWSFVARNYNDLKLCREFHQAMLLSPNAELIISYFDHFKVTILTKDEYPNCAQRYESAERSNLTIKVQDHSFLAHKEILSTRNTVFDTVISALPTTSNVASTIDIPDFDPATFENFLKFIYTGQVNKDVITKQLMKVAHKYAEDELWKICENFFVPKVCETNAVEMLILATDVGSQKLKEKASKFIVDRFAQIKLQVDFPKLKQNPKAVDAVFNEFHDMRLRVASELPKVCKMQKSYSEIKGVTFD